MKKYTYVILSFFLLITFICPGYVSAVNSSSSSIMQQGNSKWLSSNPISINGNADFNSQAKSNGWIGTGLVTNPYIITGLNITTTLSNAISIQNTDVYFIIENCLLLASSNGVYLNQVTNGVLNNNTSINNKNGFFVINSNLIQINNNTAISNKGAGFLLDGSTEISFFQNIAHGNSQGINLKDYSKNNNLQMNYIFNNFYSGINLTTNCNNNMIESNYIKNSGDGFLNSFSGFNTFQNNTIIENQYGFILENPSVMIITQGNVVKYNNFINNHLQQAVCDKSLCSSLYYNTFNLNYYSDHLTPDYNGDGIVDTPYSIYGGSYDNHSVTSPNFNQITNTNLFIFLFGQFSSQNSIVTSFASSSTSSSQPAFFSNISIFMIIGILVGTILFSFLKYHKKDIKPVKNSNKIESYKSSLSNNLNNNVFFCPICHSKCEKEDKFCFNCGQKLISQ